MTDSVSVGGALERSDVELLHLVQRVNHAIQLRVVLALHHLAEHLGDDLPRDTEAIDDPAAVLLLAAAVEKLLRDRVDLLLILTLDLQREAPG